MFTDSSGKEEQIGPHSLMVFDPGENHSVRALDEELVFVGFLQGYPVHAKKESAA